MPAPGISRLPSSPTTRPVVPAAVRSATRIGNRPVASPVYARRLLSAVDSLPRTRGMGAMLIDHGRRTVLRASPAAGAPFVLIELKPPTPNAVHPALEKNLAWQGMAQPRAQSWWSDAVLDRGRGQHRRRARDRLHLVGCYRAAVRRRDRLVGSGRQLGDAADRHLLSGDRQSLRRDRAANLAVLAGIASGIAVTVAVISMAVPQGYTAARGDPRYWLLMLPVAIWAWSAVDFARWAVRLLPVVLVGTPLVAAALALGLPGMDRVDRITWWVVTAIALACGIAGWRWRRRSGLG